ncbi:hypothetical protein [Pedobacter antarcticus]|uniref:hypothetical protein n=1 Tax=Pedobacter antarcticus TaxID=34086 RepID=UPI00292DE162|nr:hypothetical protein [Pedobacter antarcticus]
MNKLSSNIKKIALSLLVVGLAIGFSAFNDAKKSETTIHRFYNKSGSSTPMNKANYVYQTNSELCDESPVICSEEWDTGSTTPPASGQQLSTIPAATLVGNALSGDYTGSN